MWLYDEHGSRLFDRITRLPEYYLTRSERGILQAHAAEIAALTRADTLVELGSGTSEKTRLLLDALRNEGTLALFAPLDVSREILLSSADAVAAHYPGVGVHAVVGDFERHLGSVPAGSPRLLSVSRQHDRQPRSAARSVFCAGSPKRSVRRPLPARHRPREGSRSHRGGLQRR
jgi:L-histidine N-alpha-methyltransferase